ncbi:MAG TPA: UvrD-helicase domain-containing protein, partial [Thermoanaerobaculia bacterium]|nr:UvrD-helicase domain-containing protein [Thermoanaerobaculia bacterium]
MRSLRATGENPVTKEPSGGTVRLQSGKWRSDPIKKYVLRTPAGTANYRIDYDRELNEEQKAVVLAGGGPILVIAGAGTGKTRTLVYRVARLIESGT